MVIKHQRLDIGVGVMTLDAFPYGIQVIFVHHFIAFQIKSPVASAGVLGNHFLLGIDKTAICHTSYCHYEFVHQRQ